MYNSTVNCEQHHAINTYKIQLINQLFAKCEHEGPQDKKSSINKMNSQIR